MDSPARSRRVPPLAGRSRGNVRLVTLAPEWPGATRYIERFAGEGVATSIGHTRATARQIEDAVRPERRFPRIWGMRADPVLPPPRQLHLEPTRRGSSGSQLYRRRLSSFRVIPARRPARQGDRTQRLDHRRRDAGDVRAGTYRLGEVAVELKEDQRVVLEAAIVWPGRVCGWIGPSGM